MSGTRDKRTGPIGLHNYDTVLAMIAEGRTAPEMADHFDVNPETIRKFARKRGLQIVPADQTLENHPAWKGGTTLDRGGYLLWRVKKDGPYGYLIRAIAKRGHAGTDSTGYAPVHRTVMHHKLGRPLTKDEVVHHIDGDISNNHPDNLGVYASNADHLRDTLKGKVPNWTSEGFAQITGRPRKTPGPPQGS